MLANEENLERIQKAVIERIKGAGIDLNEHDPERIKIFIEEIGIENIRHLGSFLSFYKDYEKAKEMNGKIGQYSITFRGDVQDTGFRYSAKIYAKICGLTGNVKNMDDGSVNVIAQGTKSIIDCFRLGLDNRFKSLSEVIEQDIGEPFQNFKIIKYDGF